MKTFNSQACPSRPQILQRLLLAAALSLALPLFAAEPAPSPLVKTLDMELNIIESELVPLVEAMPAAQFDFAPTAGEFKGVRTFAQQAKHVAATTYRVSAVILGEKPPVDTGKDENGPENVKSKEEIIKFLKDSYLYAHKAIATLTTANLGDELDLGWGKQTRLFVADLTVWHSFDHYGQMVVYARMNGIVPPASRPKK